MNAEMERARAELRKKLRTLANTDGITRVEVSVPDIDPLAWVRCQSAEQRIFWSDRDEASTVAGIGAAARYDHSSSGDLDTFIRRMRADLSRAHPHMRCYGGFPFNPRVREDDEWGAFVFGRFVVPAIEVGRVGNECFIAVNVNRTAELSDTLALLDQLDFSGAPPATEAPSPIRRTDSPDEELFEAIVDEALEAIRADLLKKVVLARRSTFEFEAPICPFALLRALQQHTERSFQFCFQFDPEAAFVGASPERLYKRRNTYLQSESIAGTRPRGATPEEDEALSRELMTDDKESREHRFVSLDIGRVFENLCRAVRGGDRIEMLPLRHCRHLLTRFEGMLHEPDCDGEILRELHPTPAVGGVPKDRALEFIARNEPFYRGWYAAPVGWIGYDTAEFAVAIRSALVRENVVNVYSGAGVVAGSRAANEWAEIENKMRNFRIALEGERAGLVPAGPA